MLALTGVIALRMLGLFMILPVFSVYALELPSATPTLIGIAIGIYGLTQALLQIPFGWMSDRFGRKPVILFGLVLFAAGSVLAALAQDIIPIIIGRALQGSGAIAAAVMALASDLTRDENRAKAMAMIGISMGASFLLAIILGPVLLSSIGVPGIFWLTSGLAVLGMLLLLFSVPASAVSHSKRNVLAIPVLFGQVVRDHQLLRLDAGIFVLHAVITASFIVFPLYLEQQTGMETARHWQIYLPVLIVSVVFMLPLLIASERYERQKTALLVAISILVVALLGLSLLNGGLWSTAMIMVVFFTAFNLLEASLPSLVSRLAPPDARGTALGVYATSQFLGVFVGGTLGGMMLGKYGLSGVFLLNAGFGMIWLIITIGMTQPRLFDSYQLTVGRMDEHAAETLAQRLANVRGVIQAVVVGGEGIAYLKVDRQRLDEQTIREFAAAEG